MLDPDGSAGSSEESAAAAVFLPLLGGRPRARLRSYLPGVHFAPAVRADSKCVEDLAAVVPGEERGAVGPDLPAIAPLLDREDHRVEIATFLREPVFEPLGPFLVEA